MAPFLIQRCWRFTGRCPPCFASLSNSLWRTGILALFGCRVKQNSLQLSKGGCPPRPFTEMPFYGKCISPDSWCVTNNTGIARVVRRNAVTRLNKRCLPWKRNKYSIFWVCVCSLIYPACKAIAPYCIVKCGLPGCTKVPPPRIVS